MDSSLQRPTAARQLRLIRIKRKRGEAALETLVVEQEEGGGARSRRPKKRSSISALTQQLGALGAPSTASSSSLSSSRSPPATSTDGVGVGLAGEACSATAGPLIFARVDTLGAGGGTYSLQDETGAQAARLGNGDAQAVSRRLHHKVTEMRERRSQARVVGMKAATTGPRCGGAGASQREQKRFDTSKLARYTAVRSRRGISSGSGGTAATATDAVGVSDLSAAASKPAMGGGSVPDFDVVDVELPTAAAAAAAPGALLCNGVAMRSERTPEEAGDSPLSEESSEWEYDYYAAAPCPGAADAAGGGGMGGGGYSDGGWIDGSRAAVVVMRYAQGYGGAGDDDEEWEDDDDDGCYSDGAGSSDLDGAEQDYPDEGWDSGSEGGSMGEGGDDY
jgi:hypothetical protein